ncbi:MAG: ExbD/TolR family protein, partial [Myxococcales bacterium]
MAFAQMNDEEGINGINVTPLVDVMLVLLIVFMVTASVIAKAAIEVDLPRAANG